jgi:hypothetical protein
MRNLIILILRIEFLFLIYIFLLSMCIVETNTSLSVRKESIGEGPACGTFWIFNPNPWPLGLG